MIKTFHGHDETVWMVRNVKIKLFDDPDTKKLSPDHVETNHLYQITLRPSDYS